MRNLMRRRARSTSRDFLGRADVLATTGHTVMISDYSEYYRLAAYLFRYTNRRIGLAMGAMSLREIFDEQYYAQARRRHPRRLRPAVQEQPEAVHLPVHGPADEASSSRSTSSRSPPSLRQLYGYLVDRRCIVQLTDINHEYLNIYSPEVLEQDRSRRARSGKRWCRRRWRRRSRRGGCSATREPRQSCSCSRYAKRSYARSSTGRRRHSSSLARGSAAGPV